jgi:hypothetical protein
MITIQYTKLDGSTSTRTVTPLASRVAKCNGRKILRALDADGTEKSFYYDKMTVIA